MAIRHTDSCSKDIAKLLQSDDFSDVNLVVNSKRFPAHKAILATRSEYFHTLFSSGLSESQQRQIEIKESDTVLFEKLLRYIYTGELVFSNATETQGYNSETEAVQMLVLANKYLFKDLQSDIGKHLKTKLAPKSFCAIYSAAYLCSIQPLKDDCLKFADSKCDEVLMREEFSELHVDAVGEIVSRPTFKPGPMNLFQAVTIWIGANGRQQAEPILSKIRLSDVPLQFLAKIVRSTGFYSDTAILDAIGNMETNQRGSAHEQMKINVHWKRNDRCDIRCMFLNVKPADTVASMKEKVKSALRPQYGWLNYLTICGDGGGVLADHRTLEECNITSGSCISIVNQNDVW